ncbi:MAG TPA: acetyl-CoA carboxylase biotin carboxyl carrier protein [Pyrinomonadaceae bacterium]
MSEHDETRDAGRAPRAQDETRAQSERPDRDAAARGGAGGGGERRGRRRHGSARPQQQQQGQSPRRNEPSLNMEELRELAELFTSHGLTDFEFENEDIRVRLSRSLGQPAAPPPVAAPAGPAPSTAPASAHASLAAQTSPASDAASGSAATTPAEVKAEELHIITAPIVGTFYRASSPNVEAFVKAGSHVESATVVCIIEAMKLMNEIQAETTGTVEKIYVENGQPVEFGQPLFGIKK